MPQETSVLFALRDLRNMEADRIEQEQRLAADERHRRDEEERTRISLAEPEANNQRLTDAVAAMRAEVTALAARIAGSTAADSPRAAASEAQTVLAAAVAAAYGGDLRRRSALRRAHRAIARDLQRSYEASDRAFRSV